MTEKTHIWDLLSKRLSPGCHATRIENTAGTGVPDIHMVRAGRSIWVESKIFDSNKIWFRRSQPAWIARQCACGGRVWILTRRLDRVLLFDSATTLQKLFEARIAAIDGVPSGRADPEAIEGLAAFRTSKPFDWLALENTLFS